MLAAAIVDGRNRCRRRRSVRGSVSELFFIFVFCRAQGLCLADLVKGLESIAPIRGEWDIQRKRVTKGSVMTLICFFFVSRCSVAPFFECC